ncbi:MAG: response regulator transcription factor [Chloroflexi bacterium]|nr:response regulator transcription factor [Chloroflexota bacterium]
MAKSILIVEDEEQIVRVVRAYLEQAGYEVLVARNGPEGLMRVRQQRPDLVVLDLMLPGMDGLDVCRAIRRESSTPIIMLTARAEETDKLIGLEIGADDYMTKPFSPRELVARVRAVLRRVGGDEPAETLIRAANVEIDLQAHTVLVQGQQVDLTPTEFDLLVAMARHPGRVLSRAQLLDATLGEVYEGYERTIDVHIKNLRRKIEPDPRAPRYIQTVYGVGYRFQETP